MKRVIIRINMDTIQEFCDRGFGKLVDDGVVVSFNIGQDEKNMVIIKEEKYMKIEKPKNVFIWNGKLSDRRELLVRAGHCILGSDGEFHDARELCKVCDMPFIDHTGLYNECPEVNLDDNETRL